jgi:hypothetical protein
VGAFPAYTPTVVGAFPTANHELLVSGDWWDCIYGRVFDRDGQLCPCGQCVHVDGRLCGNDGTVEQGIIALQDYIAAILEASEVTETYHGLPFARKLTLRTLHGKTVTVHDPTALTNDLELHKRYQFVVVVTGVERVRAFTNSATISAKFSGTIRALKWQPDLSDYQLYHEDWIERPLSIIGTVNGHVLLSRLLLGGVAVGNAVTWGRDQFELVAVYR